MSILEYENVDRTLDRGKTWLDKERKLIYSRNLPYKSYYALVRKPNEEQTEYEYFIILSDFNNSLMDFKQTNVDSQGRINIDLKNIWDISPFKNFELKKVNITTELVEEGGSDENLDRYLIYKLYV